MSVSAQVDKQEVREGETLVFAVQISGPFRQTPKLELTQLEGFEILSTGQSQQVQIQDGEVNQALVLTYTLIPKAAGMHTIGPVRIEYAGKIYETQPIEVRVVPGSGRAPAQRKAQPAPRKRAPRLDGGVIL